MGDTLVYTSTQAATLSSQESAFATSFAHTHIPSVLAASAPNSANHFNATARMTVPHTQPIRERRATEFVPGSSMRADLSHQTTEIQRPAILLRKLPRHIGQDGVHNMLLFAKDLFNVRLVESSPEDVGFATAVAHFNTYAGAREVMELLDGKTNATGDAQIIVEMPNGFSPSDIANARLGSRRSTIDATAPNSRTSNGSGDGLARQPSRFSSTFHSNEKISPPLIIPNAPNSLPESSAQFQSFFSPQSPVVNPIGSDRQRNLGKSVINDDAVDDETDGLLRDPLAYARNGRSSNGMRSSIPQLPTAQFGSLSLGSTFDGPSPLSSSNSGIASPVGGRLPGSASSFQSKIAPQNSFGPSVPVNGPGRTSYPPANPADQNPPCNTLYVGNLPNNTSEDELKRLFSQQRGYKRLCFRTKQNGPMCFVEFENITLATQALHHLYGKMLSNSVKGGIRLSFSKNPLGVRNGQSGIPPNMMSPHGGFAGIGGDIAPPPGFASSNGPPPGLISGGRGNSGYNRPPTSEGMVPLYQAHQYSLSGAPFASQLRMPQDALYSDGPSPPAGPQYSGDSYYDASAR